jgi:hypothetical protein
LRGVTSISRQSLVTIAGRGMLGVPGIAARAFGAVARTGTSVPMISQSSSEQSICFVVPESAEARVLDELRKGFEHELVRRDIERIFATPGVVVVTVVGAPSSPRPASRGGSSGRRRRVDQRARDRDGFVGVQHQPRRRWRSRAGCGAQDSRADLRRRVALPQGRRGPGGGVRACRM